MGKHDYVIVKQTNYEGYPGEVIHVKFLACHYYAGSAEGYLYVDAFGHWFRKPMSFYPGWCMKADIPVKIPNNAQPGTYKAKACMYAYERDCKDITIKVISATLKLDVNFPSSITVGQNVEFTGKVLACTGGSCKPVPHIKVWISIPGFAMPVYTDSNGVFRFKHKYPAWTGSSLPITVSLRYQGKSYVARKNVPVKSKQAKGGVQILSHLVRVGRPVITGFDYKGGNLYIYFNTNEANRRNVYWRLIQPVRKYFGKNLPSSYSFPAPPNKVLVIELMQGNNPYNYVWQEIVRVRTPSYSQGTSTSQTQETGQVKVEMVQKREVAPPKTEALIKVTNTYPSGKTVMVRVLGISSNPNYYRPVEVRVYVPGRSTKMINIEGYGYPKNVEYRVLGEYAYLR